MEELAQAAALIPAEALAQIPGCEGGRAPLAVAPLPGGRACNQVLRVQTSQGQFVWRRRFVPVDRPGSRAADELQAQRMAAAEGLAPRILAAHPLGHWMVMEYVDAPVWTAERLHSQAGIAALGRQLAQVHALALPADQPRVDAGAMAGEYLARLAEIDAAASAGLAPLRERVEVLSARLAATGGAVVLNHGDLMASNMLGEGPLLVDWEYAQVAEPGWDLACLLTYYPDLEPHLPRLLAASGVSAAVLQMHRERFSLLNRLWEGLTLHGAG